MIVSAVGNDRTKVGCKFLPLYEITYDNLRILPGANANPNFFIDNPVNDIRFARRQASN